MPAFFKTYYQVKSKARGIPNELQWFLGGKRRPVVEAAGARVMVYHGICRKDRFRYSTTFVTAHQLEKHIRLLKKHVNILSLDEYYNKQFDQQRFSVVLTFDDGYANNYKYLLPLLDAYEIPATLFITAIRKEEKDILWNDILRIASRFGPPIVGNGDREFIRAKDGRYYDRNGKELADVIRNLGISRMKSVLEELASCRQQEDPDYWLQLSEEQIHHAAQNKWVTIGSHGQYHNDLARLPLEEAISEMRVSKDYLEKITSRKIKALAFPYGSCNSQLIHAAKALGYDQVLGADSHRQGMDDVYRDRLTINPFISGINQLHATIRGYYR